MGFEPFEAPTLPSMPYDMFVNVSLWLQVDSFKKLD